MVYIKLNAGYKHARRNSKIQHIQNISGNSHNYDHDDYDEPIITKIEACKIKHKTNQEN